MERACKAVQQRRHTDRPGAEWFVRDGIPGINGVYATAHLYASEDGTAQEVVIYDYAGSQLESKTCATLDAAFRYGNRAVNVKR
jgi:hypothetical protein